MRDYVQIIENHYTDGDGNSIFRYFGDYQEAAEFDPGGTYVFDGQQALFFLINKTIALAIMNGHQTDVTSGWPTGSVLETASPQYGIDGTKDQPNYADWPSNDGDPRNPTAEKATKQRAGAGGPVKFNDLIQELQTLYSVFYQRKLFVVANHILEVIRDCFRETVTQAEVDALFAELAKYG